MIPRNKRIVNSTQSFIINFISDLIFIYFFTFNFLQVLIFNSMEQISIISINFIYVDSVIFGDIFHFESINSIIYDNG